MSAFPIQKKVGWLVSLPCCDRLRQAVTEPQTPDPSQVWHPRTKKKDFKLNFLDRKYKWQNISIVKLIRRKWTKSLTHGIPFFLNSSKMYGKWKKPFFKGESFKMYCICSIDTDSHFPKKYPSEWRRSQV